MAANRIIMKKVRARGAAIMLALWALFLLSAVVISWALDIDTRLTISGNANRVIEATAMASSGAEIAFHPGVKPGAPVLRGGFGSTQSFEARITGESGRLNLNWLVAPPDNLDRLEVLRKYLEIKGVDLNERDHMIGCLQDWVDPDNLVRLNGAEDEPGYEAANKPLMSLDEVKRIRGWEDFTSRPDWDADFTLAPGTGQIDPNWASRDVLLSLPYIDEIRVDQFLSIRRGPDDIEGTEDDVRFGPGDQPGTQQGTLQIALGLGQEQFNELASLINLSDTVLRVTSIGKSGGVTRTVRMVIRKAGNSIQLIPGTWKEL
jgi:general secretion pathway protein K